MKRKHLEPYRRPKSFLARGTGGNSSFTKLTGEQWSEICLKEAQKLAVSGKGKLDVLRMSIRGFDCRGRNVVNFQVWNVLKEIFTDDPESLYNAGHIVEKLIERKKKRCDPTSVNHAMTQLWSVGLHWRTSAPKGGFLLFGFYDILRSNGWDWFSENNRYIHLPGGDGLRFIS